VIENKEYSKSYLDPDERSIANSIQLFFKNSSSEKIEVHYPIGHRKRRDEGIPELVKKYKTNMQRHYKGEQLNQTLNLIESYEKFLKLTISELMAVFSK